MESATSQKQTPLPAPSVHKLKSGTDSSRPSATSAAEPAGPNDAGLSLVMYRPPSRRLKPQFPILQTELEPGELAPCNRTAAEGPRPCSTPGDQRNAEKKSGG